ncbi:unnamed protein product [Lepeophtheirus salmonis]|uniref:(salmon louse) hypothetical protein n=1 Tax=Lepeophtheirus salmonis TaxID=72036 RepID=A0A7R8CK26_LEPSM|nr:unnamed protein product [Lepeophtheirus salmonis]CAF2798210.1 unnamed protein product [Lepeophtheirus salmonis]
MKPIRFLKRYPLKADDYLNILEKKVVPVATEIVHGGIRQSSPKTLLTDLKTLAPSPKSPQLNLLDIPQHDLPHGHGGQGLDLNVHRQVPLANLCPSNLA